MTARPSKRFWQSLGTVAVPIAFLSIAAIGILFASVRSRSSQTSKYELPTDTSAASMLAFIRKLDGQYDPRTTLLKTSNVTAIDRAIRQATEVLNQDRSSLSADESREADYFRLYYGCHSILYGYPHGNEAQLDSLLPLAKQFVESADTVSSKVEDAAVLAINALDLSGRSSDALEVAVFAETCFSSLPESQYKSSFFASVAGIKHRLRLLNTQLDLDTFTLEGTPLRLRDLRGKVVLLEFWSTGCGPCIADFPALKRIYQTNHHGFEILAVCLHASPSRIASFASEHELPWIQLCHDATDGNDELDLRFGIQAVPTTLLIDQTGKVIAFGIQPSAASKEQDLEEHLKRLLGK